MTNPKNVIDRISQVRLMAFDVDGVLTDGGIYLGNGDSEWKRFHAQDGAGIALSLRAGYEVALITGRKSVAVERRAAELKIQHLFQGVKDKPQVLRDLAGKLGLTMRQTMFMGDDLPDLPAMREAGFAAAPGNAVSDVREAAHYVTSAIGGHGAVREIIEIVLRNQGRWGGAIKEYFDEHQRLEQ